MPCKQTFPKFHPEIDDYLIFDREKILSLQRLIFAVAPEIHSDFSMKLLGVRLGQTISKSLK